jgi:hypothetical protein
VVKNALKASILETNLSLWHFLKPIKARLATHPSPLPLKIRAINLNCALMQLYLIFWSDLDDYPKQVLSA